MHARNVSNALSMSSGCVLSQFHVIHDDFFETVQGDMLTKDVTIKWKMLAGFTRDGIEEKFPKNNVTINKKRMIKGLAQHKEKTNKQRRINASNMSAPEEHVYEPQDATNKTEMH